MSALDVMREAELFAGLSAPQRAALAAHAHERRARAGDVLFKLGDAAEHFYVIVDGRVELTFPLLVLGEPKEARFQTLERGRTVAWSALVPPHRLTTSGRAGTDATLLAFHHGEVMATLEAEPQIGRIVMANLARVVAGRLQEMLALYAREVQRGVAQAYR